MNLKTITIALTVLVFAVLATVIMQKGSYVSQATEHYEKTTGNSFNGTSRILKFVNESIETNKTLWLMTCDAIQNASLFVPYFLAKISTKVSIVNAQLSVALVNITFPLLGLK